MTDKNCSVIIPVRIRNHVVQIRVHRTYMQPVVRVATYNRSRTINPYIYLNIYSFFYITRGHAEAFPLLLRTLVIHPFKQVVYKKRQRQQSSAYAKPRRSKPSTTHPQATRCQSRHPQSHNLLVNC